MMGDGMAVIRHEHDRLASAPCTCYCAQCSAGHCSLQSTGESEEVRLRRQLSGAVEGAERLRQAIREHRESVILGGDPPNYVDEVLWSTAEEQA
jgi:hypothetical protein